jgi:isocitrate/isopropylmalate dehydrogenase
MMLEHLGEAEAARKVEESVAKVLASGFTLTPDLGGTAKTDEVGAATIAYLEGR